jgi:hypothetical protein
MNLCKYSNIFGKPRTGVHSHRLFGLASVDLLLTLLLSYLIKDYIQKSFFLSFILLWIVGILFHLLFCVKTPITSLFH